MVFKRKYNIEFSIMWQIKSKAMPYKCGSRNCDLCLAEKVAIARDKGDDLLNKRTELIFSPVVGVKKVPKPGKN